MSSSASPAPSRRKTLLSLGVLALLTGIVVFIFREHWAEISEALSRLTLGQGLLALAVVSHFAYLLASNNYLDPHSFIPFYYGDILNQTSVVWSLLGGLLMLWLCEDEKRSMGVKVAGVLLICLVTLPSDWSCIAALCVLSIGSNRGNPQKQIAWSLFYVAIYAAVYFFALDKLYGLLQLCVVLSIPLLALYNGKRGKNPAVNKVMKWVFYLYYPLHLFVIGLIQLQMR